MIRNALSSCLLRGKHKKIWMILPLCLALLNITGCDYVYDKIYPDFKRSTEKTVVSKPPFARQNTAPNISIEKVRDIADSTSASDEGKFTVNPVALNNPKDQETNKNPNQLFTETTKTNEDRFQRIEDHVQRISDTLNRMSPSITKLIGIEGELDALTFQLEELINKGVYDEKENRKQNFIEEAQVIEEEIKVTEETLTTDEKLQDTMLKTAPAPHTKNQVNSPPQKTVNIKSASNSTADDLISKIRIGDHNGKTRIVFETKRKVDYDIEVDNENKLMLLRFPEGSINANLNRYARASALLKTIKQNKVGAGSVLEFKLNKSTSILKDFYLAPDKEVSNQRLVIDLKR